MLQSSNKCFEEQPDEAKVHEEKSPVICTGRGPLTDSANFMCHLLQDHVTCLYSSLLQLSYFAEKKILR